MPCCRILSFIKGLCSCSCLNDTQNTRLKHAINLRGRGIRMNPALGIHSSVYTFILYTRWKIKVYSEVFVKGEYIELESGVQNKIHRQVRYAT